MLKSLALATIAVTAIGTAQAATPDAWDEFATAVNAACIEAAAGLVTDATSIVDPFGSESFGLAIVTGSTSIGTTASVLCVFDKQTKAVEIGGELDITVTANEPAR